MSGAAKKSNLDAEQSFEKRNAKTKSVDELFEPEVKSF